MKHKMVAESYYPGKGIITDEEVWKLVKKHSRFIDRINTRKMVEMAISAQLILFGIYETEGWYADQDYWTFYGKKGFFTMIDESRRNMTERSRRFGA